MDFNESLQKLIERSQEEDDEKGDAKYHAKKDDELDKKEGGKKFQCCGEETDEISPTERHCSECGATWHKKESGWSKKSK